MKSVESEEMMLASRTPEQIEAQKKYESKVKEIKIRVPNAYFEKIEQSMAAYNANHKGNEFSSINKYVLAILEEAIDTPMVSIREQNRKKKEKEVE